MTSHKLTVILDYGVGNVRSIQQAVSVCGFESVISSEIDLISTARNLILPGVGSFPQAMSKVQKQRLDEAVVNFAGLGRPILGICLGMQLLMEASEELLPTQGIGLVSGRVTTLGSLHGTREVKLPNIGWYPIEVVTKSGDSSNALFADIDPSDSFYFVHSYHCKLQNLSEVAALASFGGSKFCSVLSRENIFGVQFHPEKSGRSGLKLMRNFLGI